MELTDRNEILRQMQNSLEDCPYEGDEAYAWRMAHDCCISIVKNNGRCDYCKDGRSFIGQTVILANDGEMYSIWYCPHCGAKMDGETEGT